MFRPTKITLIAPLINFISGKRPLPGVSAHVRNEFQGLNVATSICNLYPGCMHPPRPKSRVMFKRPWVLTWTQILIHAMLISASTCKRVITSLLWYRSFALLGAFRL